MNNCASSRVSTPSRCSGWRTSLCEGCVRSNDSRISDALELVTSEYASGNDPWIIGFSGGKDSSALLKLVFHAIHSTKPHRRPVTVVYCDTGVEIPVMNRAVLASLDGIEKEAQSAGLPVHVKVATPRLQDHYFVKVIGRGYPPPTNKFRWCTDRLRINPVHSLIKSMDSNATVLLGTRWQESAERARTLRRHRLPSERNFFRQSKSGTRVFAPIVDFGVNEVWRTMFKFKAPQAINPHRLASLYKDAGSECPIFRDEKGTPCGTGRFGCWTCTVVRKDKAVKSLIQEGYEDLQPLYDFRNWLIEVRDKEDFRCTRRRNGQPGLGPFTLKARKKILDRLRRAQAQSSIELIGDDELKEIFRLWRADRGSSQYRER